MYSFKRMFKKMIEVKNEFVDWVRQFRFLKYKWENRYGTDKWRKNFLKSLNTPLYDEKLIEEVLILLDYSDDEIRKEKKEYERICRMIPKSMIQNTHFKHNKKITARIKKK